MTAQFRQGDVLLMRVEELPSQAKEEAVQDKIVLAYGEVTGHSHSISLDSATLYRHEQHNYLVVPSAANLVHEEHDTIAVPAGVYKVIRQREYSPRHVSEFVSD